MTWGCLKIDLYSESWEFYSKNADVSVKGDTYAGLFYFLITDKIDMVFVNNLVAFNCKITKYYEPDEDKFFISYNNRDKEYKYYFVSYNGIEFRNLDIYDVECDTPEESYKFLDRACEIFKNKRKLSMRYNFKHGLNATLIKTGSKKDFNNADFVPRIHKSNFLTPNENDIDMLLKIYKGSFSGVNLKEINKIHGIVHSADIKSSHTAFSVYKTFPANRIDVDFSKAMNNENYHWIAEIKFENLQKRPEFIFDLSSMVESSVVILTDIDFHGWFKKCFTCSGFSVLRHQVYTKRYLPQNLIKEILKAYKLKERYKHTQYGGYFKLITEQLSFGSSIKAPDFGYEVEYINNKFTPVKTKTKTNEELIKILAKRPLSYYQGTWIAAYSRTTIITEVLRHGCDRVLHFDTDGIDYTDVYNYKGTLLGEFIQKPNYDKFKVIGDKQYVGLCGEERIIKVAGLKESNVPKDYDIFKLNKNNISKFMVRYFLDQNKHEVIKIDDAEN